MTEPATSPVQLSTARRVWSILWASMWRFRKRTLLAVGLVVLAKMAAVSVPWMLKNIVDALGQPAPMMALPVFLLLSYALLRFASTFFNEIRDVVFSRVTQRTVSDFLLRAFEHMHALGPRFHMTRQTGAMTRDIERGTAGIGFLLGVALFTIVPTIVEMSWVVGILAVGYSGWFTVILGATFIAYSVFTIVFTERRAIHQRKLNDLDSSANNRLVDSLLNYETVKYYTGEKVERSRFSAIMEDWINVGVRNQKALTLLHIGQSAIIAAAVASVMLLAGEHAVRGSMTVGDLVLINAYVIQICLPLNSLGFIFREAKDATIKAERLFKILDQRPDIEEPPGIAELVIKGGEVRFEHVEFAYEPNRPILRDVSFRIPPGGKVAVVGGSGSGKSTLARLLFRFYDVNAGRILIDGQDLRVVSQRSVRAHVGIVPQDTILFNDTIAYNIGYGRQGANITEIIDAARAAQVDELINSLPDRYETVVGERGLKLSGGERQRIAIARAILKNPPVLIFDEATSALDTRSERAIHDELTRLSHNRSTLIIAHRLSTVVDADEILVMEHGRIVERGTHDSLLARNGLYAQMWQLQQQQRELEQAEQKLAMQPVDLSSLVAGVIDGLRPALEARSINLYTSLGAEAVRVTGDPSRLHQMIWSLGEHAIEVTPYGGRVELRVERAGPHARLLIADSGAAVHAQTGVAAGAYGVSLLDRSKLEDLVALHGGSVALTHNDTGSSVIIELPLRAVSVAREELIDSHETAAKFSDAPTLADAHVMAVDDSAEARELIEAVLQVHGARVTTAASGEEALATLNALPSDQWPDVLVCDIGLGEEDGYVVIGRIRALEAQRQTKLFERLPAIALTGFAGSGDRMRALLAGFQLHLAKPVDPVELVASIVSLIRRGPVKAWSPPAAGTAVATPAAPRSKDDIMNQMKDELARRQQSGALPEQNPRDDAPVDNSELKQASEKPPGSLGIVPPKPRTDDNAPDISVGNGK